MEVGLWPLPLLLPSLCRPPSNERLHNQRPTLVVHPNVSTSVEEIWIGNVLLLETLIVKFLPAPKPFWRKDAFTINKLNNLRPCLCSFSFTETCQLDGHALTNYHQYSFLSRRCPGHYFVWGLSETLQVPDQGCGGGTGNESFCKRHCD